MKEAPVGKRKVVHKLTAANAAYWSLCDNPVYPDESLTGLWEKVTCKSCLKLRKAKGRKK